MARILATVYAQLVVRRLVFLIWIVEPQIGGIWEFLPALVALVTHDAVLSMQIAGLQVAESNRRGFKPRSPRA